MRAEGSKVILKIKKKNLTDVENLKQGAFFKPTML